MHKEIYLTEKERRMFIEVEAEDDGELELHLACDPDAKSKLSVLNSMKSKGVLNSEWDNLICANGKVKVFWPVADIKLCEHPNCPKVFIDIETNFCLEHTGPTDFY